MPYNPFNDYDGDDEGPEDFLSDAERLSDESVRAAIMQASQELDRITWKKRVPSRLDPRSILHGLE